MNKLILLLKLFWKKKFLVLASAILGYVLCLAILQGFINKIYFTYDFQADELAITEVLSEGNIANAKNNVKTYAGDYPLSENNIANYLDDSRLSISSDGTYYKIKVESKLANDTETYAKKMTVNLLANYNVTYLDDNQNVVTTPIYQMTEIINPYSYSLIGMASFILLYFIYLTVLFYVGKGTVSIEIHDNITIYKTPFHASYWKKSLKEYKSVKNIVMVSVLIALMIVSQILVLPSGFGNLIISFEYLFRGITGLLFGPIVSVIAAIIADFLGYYAAPANWSYPFFLGYTLSAALSGLIYGLFFYKSKLTFSKMFTARAIDTLLVNVILGQIWMGMMNNFAQDKVIMNIIYFSLPKNLIYLIPQAIIMYVLIKALSRFFKANRMLDDIICDNITLY